jgi:hypothetical protein
MADLNITIALEDSQFTTALNGIMSKLDSFANDTKKAFEGLNEKLADLTNKTKGTGDAFEALRGPIAGLLSLKFAEEIGKWANTIDQTAKSIGFTAGEMLALQSAMNQVGGSSQSAGRAVEMFYMKLDQARQGGLQQQVAFERLGISLDDLHKMDDQELFRHTLDALAQLPRNAASSRIEVELFSKSMRGIPVTEFNEAFKQGEENLANYGSAVEDAAAAYRKFLEIINDIKIAVAVVFQPLTSAFATMKVDVPEVISILKDVAAVIIGIRVAAMGATAALAAMAVAETEATLGLAPLIALLVKGAVALAAFGLAEVGLTKYIENTTEAIKEKSAEEKKSNDIKNQETGRNQEVLTQYAKMNAAIKEQTEAFKKNIQIQIDDIKSKDKMLGLSTEQKARMDEELKIRDEFSRKINELNVKLREAQAARPEDAQSRTVGTLKKAIADLTAVQDSYIASAGDAAAAKARNNDLDKSAIFLKDYQIKLEGQLADIQLGIDELTMTNDEKKLANIKKQTTALIDQAKIRAQARLGSNATIEDINADAIYKKEVDAITKAQDQVTAKTQESIDASREWSSAWNQAFKQYKEDATNGALAAKKIFDDTTRGMEDAIVEFAKTGKLSFSSMLNTIAEDILRSQIRQLFAQMFSGPTGGAGGASLFGSVGKMLGFADGGTIPTNAPVLVGERGPEIISGAQGMTVTPNNQLNNASPTTHNVTYNINAVDARSFQQMVAQDPSFIYAVTLRGQNMIPGAR